MSLISCPECGNQVSDHATSCPHCGFPLSSLPSTASELLETPAEHTPVEESPKSEPSRGKVTAIMLAVAVVLVAIVVFIGGLVPEDHGFDDYDAFWCAQDIVTQNLKSPSTAKFCDFSDVRISHSGNSYSVTGYVDAQNSFGATIRSNFIATFTVTDSGDGYEHGRVFFSD